jgi:exonuclease III
MKLIGYNCRTLRGGPAVRSLLDIQRQHNPDAFFLSETYLDEEKADDVRKKLKMDHMIVSPSADGRSGGLMMVWKKEVRIYSQMATTDFIDMTVEEDNGAIWRLTGFYGEPSWENKHRTYDVLRDLHSRADLPWLAIGDFNEILYSSEKEGGAPRARSRMQAFQDTLNLEDIGCEGDIFTWFRGGTKERLDRAVGNAAWSAMHPLAGLRNLDKARSDHRPICLDTCHLAGVAEPQTCSQHKFEARWLNKETVEEIVKSAWAKARHQGLCPTVTEKLQSVHEDLHIWDRKVLIKRPSCETTQRTT